MKVICGRQRLGSSSTRRGFFQQSEGFSGRHLRRRRRSGKRRCKAAAGQGQRQTDGSSVVDSTTCRLCVANRECWECGVRCSGMPEKVSTAEENIDRRKKCLTAADRQMYGPPEKRSTVGEKNRPP